MGVGVGVGVGLGVGVGVGVGLGVGVGVGVGLGVGVGVGDGFDVGCFSLGTRVHVNLLPFLAQMNFLDPALRISPTFLQVTPALTSTAFEANGIKLIDEKSSAKVSDVIGTKVLLLLFITSPDSH